MNVILRILGGLAVVFLMFLPVAGCEQTNNYNVSGLDLLKGIFKAPENADASSILFFISVGCGIAIIFMRKSLPDIILAASGIFFFFAAYLYVKSKEGMEVVELKIGAFLAIMAFVAVIVLSIIRMATRNKTPEPIVVQPPQFQPQTQNIQQTQYMPPPPPQVQQQTTLRPKFCTTCGNKFPENYQGKFCTQCGTKI